VTATTAVLRLGTRGSELALAQASSVAAELTSRLHRPVELIPVTTRGDTSTRPLREIGGTGVFVGLLRELLLDGRLDAAVHSAKDLPAADEAELTIAAVPPRADPRDALVAGGRRLAQLPGGARIGTGAPRRAAQLRRTRPDLTVVDIRGNVDTRLRAVRDGTVDAVVLAAAGLARLGSLESVDELFDPTVMLPAPAQGALAVECRTDDQATMGVLGALDHPPSAWAVRAERALLVGLSAGCTAPVGALAELLPGDERRLELRAAVFSADGQRAVLRSLSGPVEQATRIGHRLAEALLDAGAGQLVREI
jgi:hydroxymethylbilane synthase